jgi:hypothetical protein
MSCTTCCVPVLLAHIAQSACSFVGLSTPGCITRCMCHQAWGFSHVVSVTAVKHAVYSCTAVHSRVPTPPLALLLTVSSVTLRHMLHVASDWAPLCCHTMTEPHACGRTWCGVHAHISPAPHPWLCIARRMCHWALK